MNWKAVFLPAGFGVLMGVASVFGWTGTLEAVYWLIIAVLCALIVAPRVAGRYFLHGFLAGFIVGVLPAPIKFAFFTTYVANNPHFMEQAGGFPAGVSPRLFMLLVAPLIALAYGGFAGLLTLIAAKLRRRGTAQT